MSTTLDMMPHNSLQPEARGAHHHVAEAQQLLLDIATQTRKRTVDQNQKGRARTRKQESSREALSTATRTALFAADADWAHASRKALKGNRRDSRQRQPETEDGPTQTTPQIGNR
eukprot:248011-Rhodomonas_salina.3